MCVDGSVLLCFNCQHGWYIGIYILYIGVCVCVCVVYACVCVRVFVCMCLFYCVSMLNMFVYYTVYIVYWYLFMVCRHVTFTDWQFKSHKVALLIHNHELLLLLLLLLIMSSWPPSWLLPISYTQSIITIMMCPCCSCESWFWAWMWVSYENPPYVHEENCSFS